MYNELFKRYPNYKNVKDIKTVNNNINKNIVELLENSNNISSNEQDYMGRHKDNKIDSFDTRRVSFYDGLLKNVLVAFHAQYRTSASQRLEELRGHYALSAVLLGLVAEYKCDRRFVQYFWHLCEFHKSVYGCVFLEVMLFCCINCRWF